MSTETETNVEATKEHKTDAVHESTVTESTVEHHTDNNADEKTTFEKMKESVASGMETVKETTVGIATKVHDAVVGPSEADEN